MNQSSMLVSKDNRVPRLLIGHYIDNGYEELIQIEYRYASQTGFDISTRIQNHDYHLSGKKYFDVISELLDKLPISCKIIIHHHLVMQTGDKKEIVELDEHLHPYDVRNAATVLYQISLFYGGKIYETNLSSGFGGTGGTRGGALEELRNLIGNGFILNICYFCKYLIDVNKYGGTDYRHDQLYCLRDNPDVLTKIESLYPQLDDADDLLNIGTANMSALHSCSSFSYQTKPRP
jgi:hypothetical protein